MPAVRFFHDPDAPACVAIDAAALRALATESRTLIVTTFAPTAPLFSLYRTAAGSGRDRSDIDAIVLLECGSARAAVYFPAMPELGLDCARRRIDGIFASVDALVPADAFTVKTTHLVHALDAWRADRACVVPSEHVRATIFWVLVLAAYTACRWLRCRRDVDIKH